MAAADARLRLAAAVLDDSDIEDVTEQLKQRQQTRKREREEQDRAFHLSLQADRAKAAKRKRLDVALRKWREKEEPPISPTTTALRFILKDGRRLQRRFERDTLFKDVLEYVSLQLDGMSFVLDSTYPRRRYDEDDGEATLAELGMVPQFTFAVVYT